MTEADEKRPTGITPGLYVTATPIGNLSDMTARAKTVLEAADHVLCEDTRVTGKLLSAFGIKARLSAYHDHNGAEMRPRVEGWLASGLVVALVSDAGTPLISDPGYKLVSEMAAAGHKVTPIPGASALTAALSVAGLPTDKVLFLGFPPQKSGARKAWFEPHAREAYTLVLYESTRRLAASLADAASVLGDRKVVVCREMTKLYEEVVRDDLISLSQDLGAGPALKGECVVVIGPGETAKDAEASLDVDKLLLGLLDTHGVKGAASFAADLTGGNKKALYARAQNLKDNR